jgi:GT2 family glycosyltransferase
MSLARVTVITVNLDGRDHLEVLLASLARQTYPADRFEVWVVDNGSQDGSVAWLRTHHPHVRILENVTNEGFARPNNQAARQASGDLLALVNNDMKLQPDWLECMVARLQASPPDVACLGGRILSWDGSTVDFIRGTMAFNGMGFQPGHGVPVDGPEGRDFPDDLLFACGGAMLIRRDVFLEAGGFDEDHFAYYEDVDLGWRLWVLGHRVQFCPEAVCFHRHNGTSSRFARAGKVVLFERNALAAMLKNYEDATLARVFPAALLLAFKRVGVRSGLDRDAFRFGPPPPRAIVPDASLASPARKGLKALVRLGPLGFVRKVAVALARQVLRRWGGQTEESSQTAPILREAYATVVGVEDLIDRLPRLLEQRAAIQGRRRRTDAELFAHFGDALTPVEGHPDYRAAHAQVLRILGLEALVTDSGPVDTPEVRA